MNERNSSTGTIITFVVLILAIVGGSALLLITRPEPVQITINPPIPTATPPPTATPAPILVYVTGAVNEPQTTIELPVGSRVADVLAAAGGVTEDADMQRVNPAAIVRDGDQVHVPSIADEASVDADTDTAANPSALPTPSGGAIIYVNSASAEELETLPGVGPALAGRIIAYRDENGPFTSLEDLDQVSGIGPSTLENLAALISFD